MSSREQVRKQFRRCNRNKRTSYPSSMVAEPFNVWFPAAVQSDIIGGIEVQDDTKALLLPPSAVAKSYCSMYAYGNHIRVRAAESDLTTCDSGVATTFSQSCRASTSDRNQTKANLEYIGWIDEIIAVDYGQFELLVLYYTWVHANKAGAQATMKQDEYGFTLINSDRTIPYSADSFAFPLHVQQIFFVEDTNNPSWKIVLHKEARGARIASKADGILDLQCLNIGRDEEHAGLSAQPLAGDATPCELVLTRCRVLTREEVNLALQVEEEDGGSTNDEASDGEDRAGSDEVYY
jgi:hypothetical protein